MTLGQSVGRRYPLHRNFLLEFVKNSQVTEVVAEECAPMDPLVSYTLAGKY